jgi:amidase
MAEADRLFRRLLTAAMSARQSDDLFRENIEKAEALAPGDRSGDAAALGGMTCRHRTWLIDNERRHQLRLAWAEFFRDYDVLLCPPVATAAFPHDHQGELFSRTATINGQERPMAEQLFWAGLAGLCYLPATVAPAALTPGGLPVGVQIIGPQYGDLTTIRLARLLEREHRGFVPPPGYDG